MRIEALLRDIDRAWAGRSGSRITLHILGSAALMLQTDYARGTKDGDVLETKQLDASTKEDLLALAGKDTALHVKHRLYIEVLRSGFPFLPQQPFWHPLSNLNEALVHFEVVVLDVVDVVVAKLMPFRAHDKADIAAMVDRGLVPHEYLVGRFRDAVNMLIGDARGQDLPRYVDNLHQIERDVLNVKESDIELPSWI